MTLFQRVSCCFSVTVLFAFSDTSFAHHSTAGFFDNSTKIEIAGVVTDIQWRNPHTMFELEVEDEQGDATTWMAEAGSLSILRAQGLSGDILNVGDFVKILGDKSLRNRPETFARNMLLPSGEEVFLTLGAQAHFSSSPDIDRLTGSYDAELVANARQSADGIFRVWSRIGDELDFIPPIFNGNTIRSLPFTERGQEVRNSWDPSAEFILGCTDWNMPRLMGNPQPMEFVRDGDNVVIKFEEGDALRTIYIDQDIHSAAADHSLMGYSVGYWEGNALVVETNRISESSHEMPVSEEISLVERFEINEDGSQLHYEIIITDPVMLTESVTKTMTWNWRPEIQVNPYDCDEEQSFTR